MSLARIAAKQSPPYSRIRSGKRGVKGGNLRSGRSSSTSSGEVGDAEEAGRFEDQGLAGVEALADQRLELVGHVLLELEADHPAAPPPLDRGAEEADQILGLLLDLDVAVADDPEGAAAEQLVAGEERGDLAADQRSRSAT